MKCKLLVLLDFSAHYSRPALCPALSLQSLFQKEGKKREKNDGARETDIAHLCAKRENCGIRKNILYFDNWMKYYKLTKPPEMGGQRRDIWSWNWEY